MENKSTPKSTKKTRFAWCLYDFANSAFPTVIITAVYVRYFKDVVVGSADPGYSDNLWGAANSTAAAIVFLSAPLLGAVADIAGKKRQFLIAFAFLCIFATAGLYFTGAGTVNLALFLVIAGVVGFESSLVFYNAFLPELVPPEKMGNLSGKSWALGYLGGLGCIFLALAMLDFLTLIGPLVAVWFLLFSIPTFLIVKDAKSPTLGVSGLGLLARGGRRLFDTFREIKNHRNLVRFLIAYFIYNNAVLTIIVFAVAFTGDSLGFSTKESVTLVMLMNVVAAPGALVFGRFSDKIGAKKTITITLIMWLVVVAGAEAAAWPELFSAAGAKTFFWGVAVLASLCIGAIQATSRSFVGQMAPKGQAAEFYGFMAFAGKGSGILGPLVFGLASDFFDSQRVAVATVGVFFLIGLILLQRVPAFKPSREGDAK